NENSAGFVFETAPLVGCSEEMQREISGLFQHALPEGSNLQFTLWADPRIGGILENWEKARKEKGPILQKLAGRRVEFLKEHVFKDQETAPLRTFRCFVSYAQPGIPENPVEAQKLLHLKDQIQTALKSLGMPLKTWDADDLIHTLDGILNFNHEVKADPVKWNSHDSLESQIVNPGQSLQVTKDHLILNEDKSVIQTYSVRQEPDLWSLHAMGELIGDPMRDLLQIPCPFMMHF